MQQKKKMGRTKAQKLVNRTVEYVAHHDVVACCLLPCKSPPHLPASQVSLCLFSEIGASNSQKNTTKNQAADRCLWLDGSVPKPEGPFSVFLRRARATHTNTHTVPTHTYSQPAHLTAHPADARPDRHLSLSVSLSLSLWFLVPSPPRVNVGIDPDHFRRWRALSRLQ